MRIFVKNLIIKMVTLKLNQNTAKETSEKMVQDKNLP